MESYRICDEKNGLPMTLFHGIRGSRKIPLDRWIEADVKTVNEDKGTPYKSGFHVLRDKEAAKRVLLETFKQLRGRFIVRVEVRDTWPKKHSRHGVILARRMRIRSMDWAKREMFGPWSEK